MVRRCCHIFKLAVFAGWLSVVACGQTLTLSAPATVPSGQPVPITVSYTPGAQPYWEITFALSIPITTAQWEPVASICGVDTCTGPVVVALVPLPDGVWVISLVEPVGTAADGSSGPVASGTVTVVVGNGGGLAAPGMLTGTVQ